MKRRTGDGPHVLRHTGATAAWDATHDLEALRLFLGHASLETTKRYIHASLHPVRSIASATAFAGAPEIANGYPLSVSSVRAAA